MLEMRSCSGPCRAAKSRSGSPRSSAAELGSMLSSKPQGSAELQDLVVAQQQNCRILPEVTLRETTLR